MNPHRRRAGRFSFPPIQTRARQLEFSDKNESDRSAAAIVRVISIAFPRHRFRRESSPAGHPCTASEAASSDHSDASIFSLVTPVRIQHRTSISRRPNRSDGRKTRSLHFLAVHSHSLRPTAIRSLRSGRKKVYAYFACGVFSAGKKRGVRKISGNGIVNGKLFESVSRGSYCSSGTFKIVSPTAVTIHSY